MRTTQLTLFPESRRRSRAMHPAGARRRHGDVAALESQARGARQGANLHSAFVSFWATLSPERRAELRSRLAA
ncbi:MAG: hypothetical protein FJ033_01140 [Chloroflexi bacterium]|nr:hypothetical protein [Chloroflexota bacterium]